MSKDKENLDDLLKDFNVKDEDELLRKLDRDSKTIPCIVCGYEFGFDELHFIDGDPFCTSCITRD